MLFEALADDAFRPLAGKYRHVYAALLRRLNDGLFSVDVTDQPTRPEIVADLVEGIAAWRANLDPEEDADFKLTAPDAYGELVHAGWLSEQKEGWTVFVEMDERILRLVATLCDLREPPEETFGGTMVSVLSSLESAVADPATSAQGIGEAAKRANEFARYVRSVVGTLKGIEKGMLAEASLNGLVRAFFDEFVGRIVIGDYGTLTLSRNHPYSFKWRIKDLASDIESDAPLFSALVEGLAAQEDATPEAAGAFIQKSIRQITAALDSIEAFRHRIDATKANIERRFANTLRYMDLIETGRGERFAAALTSFGQAGLTDRSGDAKLTVQSGLSGPYVYFDTAAAFPPPSDRRPVEIARFRQPRPDPLRVAFERAKSDFDRRISITPERFMTYVKTKITGRDKVSAGDMPPADVEEMVIFSALLAQPGARIRLPEGVSVKRMPGRVANEWLECDDFVLEREPQGARRRLRNAV